MKTWTQSSTLFMFLLHWLQGPGRGVFLSPTWNHTKWLMSRFVQLFCEFWLHFFVRFLTKMEVLLCGVFWILDFVCHPPLVILSFVFLWITSNKRTCLNDMTQQLQLFLYMVNNQREPYNLSVYFLFIFWKKRTNGWFFCVDFTLQWH